MYSPIKFIYIYIYRQIVDIYMCVCTYIHTYVTVHIYEQVEWERSCKFDNLLILIVFIVKILV